MACNLQDAMIEGLIDFFLPWKRAVPENALSGLDQCYQYYILPRNTAHLSQQFNFCSPCLSLLKRYKFPHSDNMQHFTAGLNWGVWIMEVLRPPTSSQRPFQSQQETVTLQMARQVCTGKPDCLLLLKDITAPSLALLQNTLTLRKLIHLINPAKSQPSKKWLAFWWLSGMKWLTEVFKWAAELGHRGRDMCRIVIRTYGSKWGKWQLLQQQWAARPQDNSGSKRPKEVSSPISYSKQNEQ